MCRQYYSLLDPTTSLTFAVFFVCTSFFAASGNTLAAIILWRRIKRRPNLLLKSLVIADAFNGYISGPLFAIQLFVSHHTTSELCTLQTVRDSISVCLIAASILTVVCIAYDRYMLLSKSKNYNKYITHKKLKLLILVCWSFPPFGLTIKFVSLFTYEILFFICTALALIALCIFYILILMHTKQRKKRIRTHQLHNRIFEGVTRMSSNELENRYDSTQNTDQKACGEITVFKINSNNNSNINQDESSKDHGRGSGQLELFQKVTVLIACFCLCFVPSAVVVIIDGIKQEATVDYPLQNAFIFSVWLTSLNSCINPIIYASQYPEFQRHLRAMFKRLR